MPLDPDIAALDLDCIVYKLVRSSGWSLASADRSAARYRAFLQIVRSRPAGFTPAPRRDVDGVWHEHILDTEKYFEDCATLFGRYIHHFPYAGMFGDEDAESQMMNVVSTEEAIDQILEEETRQ
jgi:hypothetical protein